MQRSDWIVIGIVLVVDLLAIIAIALLTVLEGPVWLQLLGGLGLIALIVVLSWLFLGTPI